MRVPLPAKRVPAIFAVALSGLLLGALVVTGIGLAAGSGRIAGVSDETKALTVLRADQADLTRITRELAADEHLDEIHGSASLAADLAKSARERDTSIAVLDDPKVKADATRAHGATIAILTAFSELSDVTASDLDAWDRAEREAVTALGELDAAAAAVAALNAERPLRLDGRAIESVVDETSTYFTKSARRLARYEKKMAKFRRANRKKLQSAADYKTTVESQMAAYNATRDDLQEYLDDAQEFNEQIDAFRDELQSAKAERQTIRSTLASLVAPSAMQGQHQRLVAVLDHAIAATDIGVDLADATQDLRDDFDYETSGFELPEYDEFVDQSQQITGERDSAVSGWSSAVAAHIRRLKHPKGAPKRPTI